MYCFYPVLLLNTTVIYVYLASYKPLPYLYTLHIQPRSSKYSIYPLSIILAGIVYHL